MGQDDDAIVESALQHLGSVAERLDHYGPQSERGPGSADSSNGYGVLDPQSSTSPTVSKKRTKGGSQDGEEKKPKKTRQTRE